LNHVDVAVIGGGSAGSLAAALLGRAGISSMVVDLHQTYPVEFRCEKIHDDQADELHKTGLSEDILASMTPIDEMWEARHGYLIGKLRRSGGRPWEYGCAYEELVAAIRRQVPTHVPFINAKANSISTGPDRQTVVLSNGETWTARLVIMATGLHNKLLSDQGITRKVVSRGHSVSLGFDIAKKGGFSFPALTYFAERAGPPGYVSIFPINSRMRLNWFLYHDFRDPWVQQARETPLPVLLGVMPRLKRYLEGIEVVSDISIRPVDLTAAGDYLRPGLVLVGDSFSTSCPAAGTGLNKVVVDVERLCNHHIPGWLRTPGMGVEKLESFYSDPAKIACDSWSTHEAFYQRSLALETSLPWRTRRMLWVGVAILQGARAWRVPRPKPSASVVPEIATVRPECPTVQSPT
jgi:2-polyprenyl-6-methoxyphenol hydroxylase-like FAD-dependent oxidoreductase